MWPLEGSRTQRPHWLARDCWLLGAVVGWGHGIRVSKRGSEEWPIFPPRTPCLPSSFLGDGHLGLS